MWCDLWKINASHLFLFSFLTKYQTNLKIFINTKPYLKYFLSTTNRTGPAFFFYYFWHIFFTLLWELWMNLIFSLLQAGDSGSHLASLAATLAEDFSTNFSDVLGQLKKKKLQTIMFITNIFRPTWGPEARRVVWPRPAPALAAPREASARGPSHLSEPVQSPGDTRARSPGSPGQEELLRLIWAHLLPRTICGECLWKPDYFPCESLIKLFFNETDLWSAINW